MSLNFHTKSNALDEMRFCMLEEWFDLQRQTYYKQNDEK